MARSYEQLRATTMEDAQTLNIVVLGASFAGISAIHHIIQHALPEVTASKKFAYRVVVVSPSTHLYWNICGPRALVSASLIPHSDSFWPVSLGLGKYSPDLVEHIQGGATEIDTKKRIITIARVDSEDRPEVGSPVENSSFASKAGAAINSATNALFFANPDSPTARSPTLVDAPGTASTDVFELPYHALIIATGSTAHSPLLSLRGPHINTVAALDSFHARLPTADTVVISGGGPSGVEAAGQIAYWYNLPQGPNGIRGSLNHPGSLLSKLSLKRTKVGPHAKKVMLLSGAARLLPNLAESLGRKAHTQLTELGVRVICGVRVENATVTASTGKTTLKLSNGTTFQTDLYVPCTGVRPNTQFLPGNSPLLRDGYLATTPEPSTLRVEVPPQLMPDPNQGKPSDPQSPATPSSPEAPEAFGGHLTQSARIYAIGDCAAYSKNCILDIYSAIPVLMQNLVNDLLAHQLAYDNPYGGNAEKIEELHRQDAVYIRDERDSQVVPIGYRKPGGVGVVFGHKIPSLVVYLAKGRKYKVDAAKATVEKGLSPY